LRLLRDEELARRIAANGCRTATQNFSFERLVREVDELYSDLLAKKVV